MLPDRLDENHSEIILLALAIGSGDAGFTDDDVNVVQKWVDDTMLNAALLHGVLEGFMHLCVVDGEVNFRISEKGIGEVEEMGLDKLGLEKEAKHGS